jgi:hypothetical protein
MPRDRLHGYLLRRWNHRSQNLVVPDFGHRKRDPLVLDRLLAPTPTSRPRFDVAPPAPGGLAANGPPRLGQQAVLAPAVNGVRLRIESLADLCQPNRLMLSVGVRHGTPRPRLGRGATGNQAHDAKLTLRPQRDDRGLTRSRCHPCGSPCLPWPGSLPPDRRRGPLVIATALALRVCWRRSSPPVTPIMNTRVQMAAAWWMGMRWRDVLTERLTVLHLPANRPP